MGPSDEFRHARGQISDPCASRPAFGSRLGARAPLPVSSDTAAPQNYLTVLRRHSWLIAVTIVLTFGLALGVSYLQTPLYQAQTQMLLNESGGGIETDQLVITSREVAERVAVELGLDSPAEALEGVTATAISDAQALSISATDPDPAAAAAKADAFVASYLDFRQDQAVDQLLAARATIESRSAALREEIAELEGQIAAAGGPTDPNAPAGEINEEVQALEVEREALFAQLTQMVTESTELEATATGGGTVLNPAETPVAPVSPRPLRTGLLAGVLGLFLGVGLTFLRDYLDDVVRDEADLKRATSGKPILGRIPKWASAGDDERLATILEPSSLAAESYRELSAGVRFLLVTHGGAMRDTTSTAADPDAAPPRGRAVMLASANAGEGKTSTAANLAVAAARVGLRTVLVDADLRRPSVHKRFGLGRTTGLCDVLLGDGRIEDHLVEVGIDNLRVLAAGTIPPNPTELLAAPAMRAVQYDLLEQADLVVYDTPAVLAVPDALELGRFVDLTILVARAEMTSRRDIGAAIERLEQVGTDLAGIVLNSIVSRADGYAYNYAYREQAQDDQDTVADGWLRGKLGLGGQQTPVLRARRRAARPTEARPAEARTATTAGEREYEQRSSSRAAPGEHDTAGRGDALDIPVEPPRGRR